MADDLPQVSDLIADALDLSGTEISNILDATPFLSRLPFTESSNGTVHKYITHTSNPVVGFVAENDGRDFDHSVDTTVSASLKILDFSFAVSKPTADAWRNGGAAAYIAREAARHIRAAALKLEDQILNNTDTSNGFTGLAGSGGLDAVADAMVINAGGTTADTGSSCYLVREGEGIGVSGVYKGDGPTIELGETIVQNFIGDNGNYPAYYTPGTAWFGLQFGGTYSTSRIANLTEDSGKGPDRRPAVRGVEGSPGGPEAVGDRDEPSFAGAAPQEPDRDERDGRPGAAAGRLGRHPDRRHRHDRQHRGAVVLMTASVVSHRAIVAARGVSVTLQRGGDSVDKDAVVGRSVFEVLDDQGGAVTHETTDFLIEAALYDFGSGAVEPEKYDRVTWGGRTYESSSPGGTRVFDYSDSGRSLIRLRTTQVA